MDRIAAVAPARPLLARLSTDAAYRPCRPASAGGLECAGALAPRGLTALSGRTRGRAGSVLTADQLYARALVSLFAATRGGNARDPSIESARAAALDSAIAGFEAAARLADRPAPVLADLAAALLFRAARDGNARDVVNAIEVSDQAVELEKHNEAALFNRALAMERWGLVEQATAEWRSLAARGSAWRAEAQGHATALQQRAWGAPGDCAGSSPQGGRGIGPEQPDAARERGWYRLLGEWGAAVLAGDHMAADTLLAEAESMGRELRARGGDATLAQATAAIRAHAADPAATRALAHAH
ncbi:MAG TPA: hypothetical protein VJT67_08450, partial [Longimicrobiaceae bacterium]|nr:hypothetical protein [Longimicrobiaceae bacterium]